LRVLHKVLKARFQCAFIGLGKIDEAERLQPTLRRPHGKHHFNFFANSSFPKLKNEFDAELLVERFLQMHQAARGGKLMQFAPHFATVGQANQRKNRTPKLDAKRTVLFLNGG